MRPQRCVLIQLPIPQANFGRQTGNIPLAAACLRQAAGASAGIAIEIIPESVSSYLADAALLDRLRFLDPDIAGFSVYAWNLDRSLYFARRLKTEKRVRIIFGGPEVTPDNPRLFDAPVDFLVFGEGESAFQRLLFDPAFWTHGSSKGISEGFFESNPSPYLAGLLEPEIGNSMFLETQRGCPFNCGYCYYNKARTKIAFAPESLLLDAVEWALDRGIGEIYLLDPCLSARPGLKGLLEKLAVKNRQRRIGFVSEIRAEAVDAPLADRFQTAGFLWFEIGLQSTNPAALKLMNRRTDLKRFATGARCLKQRGILPRIDLILGLPGDDPAGFRQSVDFIIDEDLADDVQVFPLSVLPGTDFRKRSLDLKLCYESSPPYPVIETPTFSREEMLLALDYAEARLDVALYPFPDLDIAWQKPGNPGTGDISARIGERTAFAKIYLASARPLTEIHKIAQNLTHPYQIFVAGSFSDHEALCRILSILSGVNPFTPFEVVFLAPVRPPDPVRLLSAVRLRRPHFLDIEQQYLFPEHGNRSVIFTLVSEYRMPRFTGEMQRQVYWWKIPVLPERKDLDELSALDGVLIDVRLPAADQVRWQDRFAPAADDIPAVCFSDLSLQHRWRLHTAEEQVVKGSYLTL